MHPNAAMMMQLIGRYNEGDMSWVDEFLDPDAVWHAAGRNRYSGEFRGHEAIRGWFAAMAESGATVEPLDMLADDEHVAFFLQVRGSDGGLDQTHANAWRVRDGRFTEGWFMPDDNAAWDSYAG